MKLLLIFVLVGVIGLSVAQETYDPTNDDVNVEDIVADPDKLKAFMGCFIDTVTCDEVGADFKKDLPEVTAQACAKCTARQKHILKRFLEVSKDKLPQDYDTLKKKLDPEDKYYSALLTAISNA